MKISPRIKLYNLCFLLLFAATVSVWSQTQTPVNKESSSREQISMDSSWRFAFGHPYDTDKDFTNGTGYFSYFAKTGYGDGAASRNFDDRAWRIIDLPHDWAVELPFDSKGTHSHGYKAIGRNFPENSVGWYRKTFFIPESDLGKRISIDFDGVFRNSIVWVNGFYLGQEHSGYAGFSYDITDYLSYGGNNVVAVRVDATMEEGWFYEGAGIYRHTWLTKTATLHVARYGTFVSSEVKDNSAVITARATIANDGTTEATFDIEQYIMDAEGKSAGKAGLKQITLKPGLKEMGSNAYRCSHNPPTPELLDACDRLGMLVLDENRLMGSNQEHLDLLQRLIVRDRNHPSVILWSLGNEEWAIEGNITGAHIASTMQAYVQNIDSTRRITTAISGGWGARISTVIDVMGFNYLTHGNIDEHHKKFPNQPAVGAEESTSSGTRGVYENDKANSHMAATDRTGEVSIRNFTCPWL